MFTQVMRLCDGVYWVACKDSHSLAMLFWRVQEVFDGVWCEEHPDQIPNFLDYMKWYIDTRKKGEANFDYAEQWGGYNLYGEYTRKVYRHPKKILDCNKYDKFMAGLMSMIEAEIGTATDFCIVGTLNGDMGTLRHELAHAFWRLRPEYAAAQKKNLIALKPNFVRPFTNALRRAEYASHVVVDETQAYLASDVNGLKMRIAPQKIKSVSRPFRATLDKELKAVGLFSLLKGKCKKC